MYYPTIRRWVLLTAIVIGSVLVPAQGGTTVDVDNMPDVNSTAPQTVIDAVYSYLADFALPPDLQGSLGIIFNLVDVNFVFVDAATSSSSASEDALLGAANEFSLNVIAAGVVLSVTSSVALGASATALVGLGLGALLGLAAHYGAAALTALMIPATVAPEQGSGLP